jgi:hypothetical protein
MLHCSVLYVMLFIMRYKGSTYMLKAVCLCFNDSSSDFAHSLMC